MDRRLWLVAAAIVLLAALVGVLAFTGGDAEGTRLAYGVDWAEEEGPATVRDGELEEGREETHSFELERANVTQVTVQLSWSDDVGDPDKFSMEVIPPNGSAVANASRNESIEIAFPIDDPPNVDEVEASNRSQAREQIAAWSTEGGQGTWEVRVTLEDAPGRRPVSEAPDLETEPDGSNSYELSFGHQAFYADLGEPGPPTPD